MKKFKSLLMVAALSLPVLTACQKAYTETRTEEEVINELALQALSEAGVTYGKYSEIGGVPLGKNPLVVDINERIWDGDKAGLNFKFKYSLAPQENYPEQYLVLNEAGNEITAEVLASGTLSAEDFPIADSLGGAAYTLKAEVTFVGYAEGFKAPKGLTVSESFVNQKIAQKTWNALVKEIKSGSISEIKNSAYQANDMVLTKGIVTAAYNWTYDEIFRGVLICDGDDGMLLYAGNLQESFYDSASSDMKIKIGDVIQVYGMISPYNGLFEVKPQTITVLSSKDGLAEPAYRVLTAPEVNASDEKDTGALVEMHGLKLATSAIALAKLKVGDHWEIEAKDDDGKKITIYVNYHVGEEAQREILTMFKGLNGKAFGLKAMLSAYSGIQISPMMIGEASASSCFFVEE